MALDREKKLWHEQMVVWHKQNIVFCNQQVEYFRSSIEATNKFIAVAHPNVEHNINRTERKSMLEKLITSQENIVKWHTKQIEFHSSIVRWGV